MSLHYVPGLFTTSNTSLRFLMRWAYGIDDTRLIGAAKSLDSMPYDIVARLDESKPARGHLELMVQSLLAERFHLRVHSETRDLPFYNLVIDGSGPKVHPVETTGSIGQDPFKMTDRGRLVGNQSNDCHAG